MILPANIYNPHNYTTTPQQAVADALAAGTDIDCGIFVESFYEIWLPVAYNESLITESQLRTALTRQYASLVRFVRGRAVVSRALIFTRHQPWLLRPCRKTTLSRVRLE